MLRVNIFSFFLLLLCILFYFILYSVVTYVTDMTRGKEREQEREGVEEKQEGGGAGKRNVL